MITKIILKWAHNKVCKKIFDFLIFKIPLTYFLPITKKNIPENFLLAEIFDIEWNLCETQSSNDKNINGKKEDFPSTITNTSDKYGGMRSDNKSTILCHHLFFIMNHHDYD